MVSRTRRLQRKWFNLKWENISETRIILTVLLFQILKVDFTFALIYRKPFFAVFLDANIFSIL